MNTDHLENDLKMLERSMDDEKSVIYTILSWFVPIARLLLSPFFFSAIALPTFLAFGGARTFMEKHEEGLQSQRRVVKLQEKAITLLDDRRACALQAIAMTRSTRHSVPSLTVEIPDPYLGARLNNLEMRLLKRVEWILRELQSRNQKLIEEQQDLREAEKFRDNAEGKTDEEILNMAKEQVQQFQARQNSLPSPEKPPREGSSCPCIIL